MELYRNLSDNDTEIRSMLKKNVGALRKDMVQTADKIMAEWDALGVDRSERDASSQLSKQKWIKRFCKLSTFYG